MVGHQTVGEGVGDRRDVLRIFLQKVIIVARPDKKILETVGMVENVVAATCPERDFVAHGDGG